MYLSKDWFFGFWRGEILMILHHSVNTNSIACEDPSPSILFGNAVNSLTTLMMIPPMYSELLLLCFSQMLPKEELYTPPMNIRVRDNRQFGRKPMVGIHVLKSLEPYRCNPALPEGDDEDMDLSGKLVYILF